MLLKKNEKIGFKVTFAALIVCIGIAAFFFFKQPETDSPGKNDTSGRHGSPSTGAIIQKKIETKPEIEYRNLEQDEDLKNLMHARKKELGLDKSLDMIVQSDETFTIGDVKTAMGDILKQAFKKENKVYAENIGPAGELSPRKLQKFGIYVVQPGDNIWNIHFNILKEYYSHKGIKVAPRADEPGSEGTSSGIGKILKFSETMIIIYNLMEKKVDTDIDLLEPLSKIVVYNMEEVFSLLQEINYENINRIQFDGQTIWIPTEKL